MFRDILGNIEQLDTEENTMLLEQLEMIGCGACDSSAGRRDNHVHFLTVALNNQLDNAFDDLCRQRGDNIDLKVAQLIEMELDAATFQHQNGEIEKK